MQLLIFIFASVCLLSANSQTILRGYSFLDNNQTIPWVEENGNATFEFSSYPVQFAFCMKINLRFERYITYAGLIYIEDMENGDILVNVEISNNRAYNFFIEFPSRSGDFEWHFGEEMLKANFLRKWTWFCFSMDFKEQTANFAVNGRLLKPLVKPKLDKDIPSCKKCRLNVKCNFKINRKAGSKYRFENCRK